MVREVSTHRPEYDLVPDGLTGDPYRHGTEVAGVIAASLDGRGMAGLADQAQITSYRIWDAHANTDYYTFAQAIIQTTDEGHQVLNLSFAGGPDPIEHAAIQYAASRGVTLVASSGNDYEEGNPARYPAAFDGVLGVGAHDKQGRATYFSSSGRYVDLSAPGQEILTTTAGGSYRVVQGTSFSGPYVAAAAALVRSANPTLTKAQVDDILVGTVDQHRHGAGHHDRYGLGLLRADRAVERAASMPGGRGVPQVAPAARVAVKPVSRASKLHVNVNPNKGRGFWTFTVERQASDGTWVATKGTYRTKGSGETRTIDLPRGTYRVIVDAKYGHIAGSSTAVTLHR